MNFDIKNKYFKNIKLAALLDKAGLVSWLYLGSTSATGIDNLLKYGIKFEPTLKYVDTILSNYWAADIKNMYKPNILDLTSPITILNEIAVPLISDYDEISNIGYFSSIRTNDFKTYLIFNIPENIVSIKLFDEYVDTVSTEDEEDILVEFSSKEISCSKILFIEMSMNNSSTDLRISSFIYNNQKDSLRNKNQLVLRNDYLRSVLEEEPGLIKTSNNLVFDLVSKVLVGTRPSINTENLSILNSKKSLNNWSPTTAYNEGDIVICNLNDTIQWVSLINKNIGEFPETSVFWRTLDEPSYITKLDTTIKLNNLSSFGDCRFTSTKADLAIINKNKTNTIKISLDDNKDIKFLGFYGRDGQYLNYQINSDGSYEINLDYSILDNDEDNYLINYRFTEENVIENEAKITIKLDGYHLSNFIDNLLGLYILDNITNLEYNFKVDNYTVELLSENTLEETALILLIYNGKLPEYVDGINHFTCYLRNTDNYLFNKRGDSTENPGFPAFHFNRLVDDAILLTYLGDDLLYYYDPGLLVSTQKPTFEIIINDSISDIVSIGNSSINFDGIYYSLELDYSVNGDLDTVSLEIIPGLQTLISNKSTFISEEVISTYTGGKILICSNNYVGLCPGVHYTIKLI